MLSIKILLYVVSQHVSMLNMILKETKKQKQILLIQLIQAPKGLTHTMPVYYII